MFNANFWFASLIWGSVGMGYFIYGKKQGKLSAMLAGAALCIYPYLFGSTFALCAIGIALIAAPFFFEN